MNTEHRWSPWYYGITHLVVHRGVSKDVATLSQIRADYWQLWLYNTADAHIWTDDRRTTFHPSAEAAMRVAEERYGVRAEPPTGTP